jgi:nucleotide-binding universal stress UspA family protein
LGAHVAFHCIPPYQYPIYLGGIPFEYPSQADYDTQCRAIAERYLKLLVKAAEGQGVAAGTRIVFHGNAAQAIVEAARDEHCGLVFMGSHGRGGWSSAFLGSVTLKALTLTHLPILVDRPTATRSPMPRHSWSRARSNPDTIRVINRNLRGID